MPIATRLTESEEGRPLLRWICVVVIILMPRAGNAQVESFESIVAGTIDGPTTSAMGVWDTDGGAEVSTRRAASGRKALRIFGGENRSATLTLDRAVSGAFVAFSAERWTRRSPFRLVVEARVDGEWREAFVDDGTTITIGGYNARPGFEVQGRLEALRFECTAPEGGGVLIDDLAVEHPTPMRIVSVTPEQPTVPVLVGDRFALVAGVSVETAGRLDPLAIDQISWFVESSAEVAGVGLIIDAAEIPAPVERGAWGADDRSIGELTDAGAMTTFEPKTRLRSGANRLWLVAWMNEDADIGGWIAGRCVSLTLSSGDVIEIEDVRPPRQRLGLAVRDAGDDGAAVYRIPGITTTLEGTLIAVYDVRWRGWGDLPGDIDVGMSRSTDGGQSWEPMRVILDMGDDPEWSYDGVGDPAVLVDELTGTIWVAATWSHGDRSWNGSGPGMTPEETGQLMLARSDDDGLTWSEPINVTEQVKDPEWAFVLPSPGRGITTADGTLVFGGDVRGRPADGKVPCSTLLHSRDRGETWTISPCAKSDTTECQPVELSPGLIMLNMRDNRGRSGTGSRAIRTTSDLGASWDVHPTSMGALPEPVCNAGLLKIREGEAGPWLVFVNPAVASPPRREMTIKLSTDGGETWPRSMQILLDSGTSAGYPSLTLVDDETIGVLYESSRAHLVFQRIPIGDFFVTERP